MRHKRFINRKFFLYLFLVLTLENKAFSAVKKSQKSGEKTIKIKISQPISSSYFLQIKLKDDECEKAIAQNCNFRDKLLQEPYFHETTLNIIENKVFATQIFNDKTITLQVKDGNYLFNTTNNNKISFNIKDGEVSNLELQDGNLIKENNNLSKCEKAKNLYEFYNIYKKFDSISTKTGLFKDEYNFSGIKEYFIFANQTNPEELMAVARNPNNENFGIENLQLCRNANSDILRVKYLEDEECNKKDLLECSRYQDCRNEIVIKDCEINLFQGFDEAL